MRRDTRLTPIHRRQRIDISITGTIYGGLVLFMCVAAVNTQASLLFGIFGVMVGVLMVSFLISTIVLQRITVRRMLPDQAIVAQPAVIHYVIKNRKRIWPSLSVTISELDAQGFVRQPHAYLLHVANQQAATISCEVIPKRRGLHLFNRYQISTSFPFGFIKRATERALPDTLLIFPAITPVDRHLLAQIRSDESLGHNVRQRVGGQDEFYGLKPYRQGESPRFIHWKRSARTGNLVSRQMTRESPPRLLLVVDTFNPDGNDATIARIERSIAQAASLVEAASLAGFAIGLVCRGEHWVSVKPNRGKRHQRELLTILARLPSNRAWDTQSIIEHASMMNDPRATKILFSIGGISSRGYASGMFVIAADSADAARWFPFDPSIDFLNVAPIQRATK